MRNSARSLTIPTLRAYLTGLRQFCKYIEMTPDQLTDEKGKDSKSPDVFIRRRAGRGLTAGSSILRTARKGRNKFVQRFYAVCSFYEQNCLQLKRREEISLNTIG